MHLATYGEASVMPALTANNAPISQADPDGIPEPKHEVTGLFTLGQNHPNPHSFQTTVPFTLDKAAEVKLGVFDLLGRKVASIVRKNLKAGEHSIALNLSGLGLNAGNYVYQLQISNAHGVYCQQRVMTVC